MSRLNFMAFPKKSTIHRRVAQPSSLEHRLGEISIKISIYLFSTRNNLTCLIFCAVFAGYANHPTNTTRAAQAVAAAVAEQDQAPAQVQPGKARIS